MAIVDVVSTPEFLVLNIRLAVVVVGFLVVGFAPLFDEPGDVGVGVGGVMGRVGESVQVLVLADGEAFDVAKFVQVVGWLVL